MSQRLQRPVDCRPGRGEWGAGRAREPGKQPSKQCCARSGHAAHRRKILEECTELALEWLACGGVIEIWSWAKQKVKRGGKAMRWTPKVEEIMEESFDEARH